MMSAPFPNELRGRDPLPFGALLRPLYALLKDVLTEQEFLIDVNRRNPSLTLPGSEKVTLDSWTSITLDGRLAYLRGRHAERGRTFDCFISLAEAKRFWNDMAGQRHQSPTTAEVTANRSRTVSAKNAAAVIGAILQVIAAPEAPNDFLRKLKCRNGTYATKLSRASLAAVLVNVIEATSAKDTEAVPSAKTVERILKDAEWRKPQRLRHPCRTI